MSIHYSLSCLISTLIQSKVISPGVEKQPRGQSSSHLRHPDGAQVLTALPTVSHLCPGGLNACNCRWEGCVWRATARMTLGNWIGSVVVAWSSPWRRTEGRKDGRRRLTGALTSAVHVSILVTRCYKSQPSLGKAEEMLLSAADYEEGEGSRFLRAYAQISHVSIHIRHSKKPNPWMGHWY